MTSVSTRACGLGPHVDGRSNRELGRTRERHSDHHCNVRARPRSKWTVTSSYQVRRLPNCLALLGPLCASEHDAA